MNRSALVLTAVVALLALPSAALGATASVADGQLRYIADPPEINVGTIEMDGETYVIRDFNVTGKAAGVTLKAGPGCALVGDSELRCAAAGVRHVFVSLRNFNDHLNIGPVGAPLTLSGGRGHDTLNYPNQPAGLAISADGRPDDGPLGRDNIRTDVEGLIGGSFTDTLRLGPSGGLLVGREGDDELAGGRGSDRIQAANAVTDGTEAGFYSEGVDTIKCGRGHDTVFADAGDNIARDCEIIGRNSPGGFRISGTHRPERINVPCGWEPAAVYGRGGGDLLFGAPCGRVTIYGGTGDDMIYGGKGYSNQADQLEGGSGNDSIYAADEGPTRDVVRCGPGRDRAVVDGADTVSGCERVTRVK